jgi:hypothetical protein
VSEVALQHCGLYELCECGGYVQLDFENALNSLADATDRQILRGGWVASEVGWICYKHERGRRQVDDRTAPFRKMVALYSW